MMNKLIATHWPAVLAVLLLPLLVFLLGCSIVRPGPVTCEIAREIVRVCDAQGLAPLSMPDGMTTCEVARLVLAGCTAEVATLTTDKLRVMLYGVASK